MTRSIFYLFLFLMGISLVYVPNDYNNSYLTLQPLNFDRPIVSVDLKQVDCLAKNIFYEASGESIIGQAAVARVVLNRMNHGFAKTPCGVIYQSSGKNDTKICQFSWVCADVQPISKNHPVYEQAEEIARDVLLNDAYREVIPESVLFFHSVLIAPNWTHRQVKRIGNHLFYSRVKKSKPE